MKKCHNKKKVLILDLVSQYKAIKKEIMPVIEQVMLRGDFILGRDVFLFEQEFAKYCKSKFCVGVNSGTDALFLALRSLGIGPGDEVILPVFTFIATALAVTYTGARPVFVDINEQTYNMDSAKIEEAVTNNTRAIIPVHLYGQSADMAPILALAKKYNLSVIEDAAQAQGAGYKMPGGDWRIVGSIGNIGCFSFYPTKNLGAYGDAGAVVTDNEDIYGKMLILRDCGRKTRYEHVTLGYNSRLDTLQAAILRIKLKYLDKWNALRKKRAALYSKELSSADVVLPQVADYARHVYHQYAVRVKNRGAVIAGLEKEGIGVLIHYPIPLHLQEVYSNLGYQKGDFPVAEKVTAEIISLPIYPNIDEKQIRLVTDSLKKIIKD
jgi:dTDP-4-amino-4,6-dideoxygalactose transaminase